nr:hepcidin [Pogona vitticeps]
MKLQLVCVIILLLCAAIGNLCAFRVQTDDASLDTQLAETSGLQMLLRRPKRHIPHFPICTYCCNCCRNKGCGLCCRT